MLADPPIIILIRPQMGENIGAVARAMGNFGLSELRIVEPRDGWPNAAADAMATGALSILQAAKIFPDVASAMQGITRAYATTARPRDMEKRVLSPEAAMGEITGRMALVFGPERTGLTNEDLSWCESIITIPTSENSSLNIAQSMVVLGYAWFCQHGGAMPASEPEEAPLEQYDHLFKQMEIHLEAADFFKAREKKPGMLINIRNMMLRGRWTKQEMGIMHGIIRALAEKP
jgi:tRNA/rRNA methyltransferase